MALDVRPQEQRAATGQANSIQRRAAVPQVRGFTQNLPCEVGSEVIHDGCEVSHRFTVVAEVARLDCGSQLVIAQVIKARIGLG
jgi:hypothetical protein